MLLGCTFQPRRAEADARQDMPLHETGARWEAGDARCHPCWNPATRIAPRSGTTIWSVVSRDSCEWSNSEPVLALHGRSHVSLAAQSVRIQPCDPFLKRTSAHQDTTRFGTLRSLYVLAQLTIPPTH